MNFSPYEASDRAHSTADHKAVRLFFKKNGRWHHESITLVWHKNNTPHNLKLLINQWLTTATDEHIIPPNITLESIALGTPGSDLFISFDHTLFKKDDSIMHKWSVVEGLIKTIYAAINTIHALTLQVHHQPILDDHLELAQAIPIQEFCS